jgi:thioredoxin-related protein
MLMAKELLVDRRAFLTGVGGALALSSTAAMAKPILGDDGIYTQDWYLQSFLDFSSDLKDAVAAKKHFAVQWGERGCWACKRLHTVYFTDPKIESFVRTHFNVVVLDLYGAREVTDVFGTRMREKALAAHYGIRTTPAFQFFEMRDGKPAEVARMPGLLAEPKFFAMFQYVASGAYEQVSFEQWLARPTNGKS